MGRPRSSHNVWTPERLERLRHLREDLKLMWRNVGEALGTTGPKAATAYSVYVKHGHMGKRRSTASSWGDDSPIGGPGKVAHRVPSDEAVTPVDAKPPAPGASRRYLASMQDDVLLRVQHQGITAGLLGDPPAGRSALDLKQQESMALTTNVRMQQPSVREQGAR